VHCDSTVKLNEAIQCDDDGKSLIVTEKTRAPRRCSSPSCSASWPQNCRRASSIRA